MGMSEVQHGWVKCTPQWVDNMDDSTKKLWSNEIIRGSVFIYANEGFTLNEMVVSRDVEILCVFTFLFLTHVKTKHNVL